jgi:uncharacterized membrane protein/ketosteroid isomerase-like protein
MINPNLHPLLVHFTVALLVISTVLFILSRINVGEKNKKAMLNAARINLWVGVSITIATIAAGFYAYGTVAHDTPSHTAMTDHKNWAIGTGIIFGLIGLWSWNIYRAEKAESRMFVLVLSLATVILAFTAWKGGELVYRYGLGVMSLPEVAEGSEGHDHEHAEGEGHGDAPQPDIAIVDESKPHDHAEGEGHAEAVVEPVVKSVASPDSDHDHPNTVMIDPALVADALHKALNEGNGDAVGRLLATDVAILEGGHAQFSRAEYMGGHMLSDMAFLSSVTSEIIDRKVNQSGNLAWVITNSRTTGEYNEQVIDRTGREMLVMEHNGHDWEITLIHWGE